MKICGSLLLAGVLVVMSLSGCGSSPADPGTTEETPAASDAGGHEGHDSGVGDEHASHEKSDMDMMREELAKLPPADAASAEKQHICPVSGKMLGTMGAPQKVEVDGQQVWICCQGCKAPLLEKPAEYLAKLKKE